MAPSNLSLNRKRILSIRSERGHRVETKELWEIGKTSWKSSGCSRTKSKNGGFPGCQEREEKGKVFQPFNSILLTAAEVVNAIKASKDVQALCLEGNTIGVEAAEAIGGALATRPELEVCD